jgi:hypothetical protein
MREASPFQDEIATRPLELLHLGSVLYCCQVVEVGLFFCGAGFGTEKLGLH